jgi:hypothetical protein
MKLNGIQSSKGRRIAWERNQARRAPCDPVGALPVDRHQPTPLENGAIKCSCGHHVYSPAAYAVHCAGGHAERDAVGGVFTLGPSDPWPPRDETPRQGSHDVADVLSAEQREVLVDAYYAEQRRRQPEIADGVSASAFFE